MASIGNDNGLRRILFVCPKDGSRKTVRLGSVSKRDAEATKLRIERLIASPATLSTQRLRNGSETCRTSYMTGSPASDWSQRGSRSGSETSLAATSTAGRTSKPHRGGSSKTQGTLCSPSSTRRRRSAGSLPGMLRTGD